MAALSDVDAVPVLVDTDENTPSFDPGKELNMNTPILPLDAMDRIADDFQGRMGFYVEDLDTGAVHRCNADRRFPTASVIKIAVMVELFGQVEAGELSLNERRRLEGDICGSGSGTLSLMVDHPELSLRDYCRMMISISDNSATDFLMGVVGLDRINATVEELGYHNIRASKTMGQFHYAMCHLEHLPCTPENDQLYAERMASGGKDYGSVSFGDSLENNVAAPEELADLLKRLHRGELVSLQASADMIAMLKLCNDRRMICRDLAREVEIAHKSGSSGRIKGNAGIVYLPTGPLVVSAFALADDDGVDGGAAIADLSRQAVEALSPDSLAG